MISNKQNNCVHLLQKNNSYIIYSRKTGPSDFTVFLKQIMNTHIILDRYYVISWRVNHRLLLTNYSLFTLRRTRAIKQWVIY
jgi:hypothetical protein